MNKRNWISALLAVMMVISMMACIVVPVAAEEYTLPNDAVHIDDITALNTEGRNIYIESAKDLVTLSTKQAGKLLHLTDVVYLKNDIDVSTYKGADGTNTFATDYAAMTYGKSGVFSIDGLGHVISNWNDTQGMFAEYKFEKAKDGGDVYIKNLTMLNAVVDNSSSPTNAGILLDKIGAEGTSTSDKKVGSITIENVHIIGCRTKTNGHYAGALIGRETVKNTSDIDVIIKDCSIVGNVFEDADGGTRYGAGIVIGRADANVSSTLIENCVVRGNTILGGADTYKDSGGMLVGDAQHPITFKNVSVVNNTRDMASGGGYTGILTHNIKAAATIVADGIFAAGNVSLIADVAETTVSLVNTKSSASDVGSVTVSNYKTDSNVALAVDAYDDTKDVANAGVTAGYSAIGAIIDQNASVLYTDWGFKANAAGDGVDIVLLKDGEKAPAKVSFTADSATTTYYTDLNGNVRVVADANGLPVLADAAAIAALGESDWKAANGTAVNAGADWTTMVVDEDTAYTKVSLPPYTMTLDKDTYVKGDIVTATVSLVAGSNLQGIEVGFNYDDKVLTPVADANGNYATAANGWLVVDKAASENMMAVTAAALSGENATEAVDVFSVKFKVTQDLAFTATELALTAVLEYAGGMVGDVMTALDLEAYSTVEIVGAAAIKNNDALDEYYTSLPKASTAVRYDGVSAYQIDSVAELLLTQQVLRLRGYSATSGSAGTGPEKGLTGDANYAIWNFEPTDTIYLTADLDISDWDYTPVASYDEATGLYTPFNVPVLAASNRENLTWAENTNGTTAASLEELFSLLYTGWSWGYSSGRCYNICNFNFDGLGHTIYNYTDNYSFFRGNYVGSIRNLTFEGANVQTKSWSTYTYIQPSILVGGTASKAVVQPGRTETTLIIENVHINNSVLDLDTYNDNGEGATLWKANSAGLFMADSNENSAGTEDVEIRNCSAIGSDILFTTATVASPDATGIGLLGGRITNELVAENLIFEDCSIVTANKTYHSLLIGGAVESSAALTRTFKNIAMVDCKYIAPNATAANVAILSSFNKIDRATQKISNLYLSGNTFATSAESEAAAIPNVVVFPAAANAYKAKYTVSGVVADAGVTTAINWTADASKNSAVSNNTLASGLAAAVTELEKTITEAHWRVNADGSLYLLGQEVIFKSKGEEDMVRYTSRLNEHILYEETENGFVAVDPALFTKLTNNYWYEATITAPVYEDFIESGYDWEDETYAKDVAYIRVPNASEATKYDGYTVYVIPTVDELIAASCVEVYDANKVTFPSKADSFGGTNSRAHGGFVEKTSVRGDFSTYNTIYITNDLDIAAWEEETGKVFKDEYDGWQLSDAVDPSGYTTFVAVFDGLNHTISGFEDDHGFVAHSFNGVYRNLIFDGIDVTTTEGSFLVAAEKGGALSENVHFKNSTFTTSAANYVGFFAGPVSGDVRPTTIKNCTISDSHIVSTAASVGRIGLFAGSHRSNAVQTIENCYAYNSTITVNKLTNSGNGLLVGVYEHHGSNVENTSIMNFDNVGLVNCGYIIKDEEGTYQDTVAVVTGVNTLKEVDTHNIGTVISVNNTVKVGDNDPVAIDKMICDKTGQVSGQAGILDANFIADTEMTAIVDTANETTAGTVTVDDTLTTLADVVAILNEKDATADWYLDNGEYVPACAMNGTVGERLNVGHNDIADMINNAKSGDTVKLCFDQSASTVAIPAGVTIELDGYVLDAIVGGEGYVNDNSDGKGGVTGLGTIGAANAQLPLNDEANGVYRFYNLQVVAGTNAALEGNENARKFRLKLNFTNTDAYALLAAGTSGMTLQAVLSSEALEGNVTYTFKSVVDYAKAIVENEGKSYSLVLKVYGMDAAAGTDLNITYNAVSYGAVKSGTAAPYAVPAVEA